VPSEPLEELSFEEVPLLSLEVMDAESCVSAAVAVGL
jgi:hypothetical protein